MNNYSPHHSPHFHRSFHPLLPHSHRCPNPHSSSHLHSRCHTNRIRLLHTPFQLHLCRHLHRHCHSQHRCVPHLPPPPPPHHHQLRNPHSSVHLHPPPHPHLGLQSHRCRQPR